VSRRPPPNTPHWQFLVRVFKEIAPRSWLKTAAEWAGFVNGRDLRRSVDRELNFE
jgi:pyruvate-formate lyase-activating enzyme